MDALGDRIRDKAIEIGFDKVGIAAADALTNETERLLSWLANGYHGEMAWMARDPAKRTDPRAIFPGAKTVVVVGLNYYTPYKQYDAPDMGKISRYSWGDDYHDVMREKMGELLDWIKTEVPGAEGKICVDTAPMMDKAWAVKAGLGWIGKHSNVITQDIGSWIFLGEILLSLDLEPDIDIVNDHCGTCTACLDACPTGAIVEPYVVDSTRCISYGTIELRSQDLPREISSGLEGWIYGCDICQDVCPWNRFEQPANEPRFEPRNNETSLVLDDVIGMSHETYVERFRHSAIKRAKLSGLQRNARTLKQGRS